MQAKLFISDTAVEIVLACQLSILCYNAYRIIGLWLIKK